MTLEVERASDQPTPQMLADAYRRNGAPRSLTSWICGDPPPGQSALDKKRAKAAPNLWDINWDAVR